MTAQINDTVFHRKIHYSLAGIHGSPLFEPGDHGLSPRMLSTACWRGYYAEYVILENHLFLQNLTMGGSTIPTETAPETPGPQLFGATPVYDEDSFAWVYRDLREAVKFTGTLLLADQFIRELYVHMGFHPAWKYRDVREVRLEEGRLVGDQDLSAKMEQIRKRALTQPLEPGPGSSDEELDKWIEQSFSRDFTPD